MGQLRNGCEIGIHGGQMEVRLTGGPAEPLNTVSEDYILSDLSPGLSSSSDFCLRPSTNGVFLLTRNED